jgi:hypothetical protein
MNSFTRSNRIAWRRQGARLPVPSIVRPAKLAMIEAADAAKLGSLKPTNLARVQGAIRAELEGR